MFKAHQRDLWAEPLDAGISRVLADNLQPSENFITRNDSSSSLVEVRNERGRK